MLLLSLPASAAPTQEDVFRSIQDSVGGQTDAPEFLPYAAGIVGLMLLVIVIAQRKKKPAVARFVNHHGKLMREILRTVPLRSAEVKQLKIVAEQAETDDGKAPNPLTLLLCPSLMAKTIQTKRMKVDRRALASIARKAGLQVTRK